VRAENPTVDRKFTSLVVAPVKYFAMALRAVTPPPAADSRGGHRSFGRALLVSCRPKQWVKNSFLLVPATFAQVTAGIRFFHLGAAFVAFCLGSSALYLVNDVTDRELDRLHVRKRNRPIATGELAVGAAYSVAAAFLLAGLALAAWASAATGALLALYVVLTLAYSWRLKHIVVLDVLILSSGFVIRVAAGAYALNLEPSEWLLTCAMFLALFLGFGKRRHELLDLGDAAGTHRPVLADYTRELLDQFLNASMMGALLAYSMYTFFSPTASVHGTSMMATIPFAVYGLFRYSMLIHMKGGGGSPEEILLSDRPMQLAVLLWGLVGAFVVYGPRLS